ncbi:MAG: hypothetical protein JHD16_06355 [Solirubrobacteraceae bacterium]|nr:hypothetical protein [Solirubrobacteraceae bacterium]
MARDSSPLSKRLKALAVRAGLPVDAGTHQHAATSTTPDDEQPTGEFPAVAASDAPADDLPTGEFPAVATVPDSQDDAGDTPAVSAPAAPAGVTVPPPLLEEPSAPAPAAPIWTDSPAEEQSPLTAASTTSGPTLPPPTLNKPQPTETAPPTAGTPDDEDAQAPQTELHALAEPEPSSASADTAATSIWAPVGPAQPASPPTVPASAADELPSRAAGLNDALALAPDGDDDAPAATEASTPESTGHTSPTPASETSADDPADTPSLLKTVEQPEPDAEPDDVAASEDAPEPSAAPSVRDRLSLTGRFAALRRKPKTDDHTEPSATGPEDGTPQEPATIAAPAVAATPVAGPDEPPMVVDVTPSEPPPTKPSFSERAALRRRAKTLRARRDAGLLELGAIVLDQRRFGDPTAGALLRRRTDELADLDHEIASIEQALDAHASAAAVAALGAIRCVGCSSLVGPTERYCAHCGTPRPVGGSPEPDASAPS